MVCLESYQAVYGCLDTDITDLRGSLLRMGCMVVGGLAVVPILIPRHMHRLLLCLRL